MNYKEKKFIIFVLFGNLICLLILFMGIGVYALCMNNEYSNTVSQNETSTKIGTKTEDKISKVENKEIVIQKEDTQDIEKKEENAENPIIDNKITENKDDEKNKTKTYTTPSGETYEIVGTVNIPRLGIKYPILADFSEELMKISVTKYWGSYPNEVGNLCILGHNYKNSKFFGNLPNIEKDDIIQITDVNGNTLNYTVYEMGIISPEDTACTSQLTNGNTEVTLLTCYYENGEAHASKRFYVKARAN